MKLLRNILIRLGVWGYFYPPYIFGSAKVHRDWPWKKKPLTADEIMSVLHLSLFMRRTKNETRPHCISSG
jgi:hypothetical protein